MTDRHKTVSEHMSTAKEHLAGVKAAQAWIQDLTAAHLLDSERPIKDEPLKGES